MVGLNVKCPCCQASDSRAWAEENGFTAVKCVDCGMVYVNPRPTDDEITQGNIVGEHRTADGKIEVVYRRSSSKVKHYRAVISEMMSDMLRNRLAWLDVGAGFGELLEALQPIVTSDSYLEGLELMVPKVKVAQSRGLNVKSTNLSEIPRERFDVVSLINVFSHIPDFDAFLGLIKQAMKKEGVLFLETGNGGDLALRKDYPDLLCLPDHLMFGGVEHIKRILSRNGFRVVDMKSMRRDTFVYCTKSLIKKLLGRPATLQVPYTSPFRTIVFRAQRIS